MNTRLVWFKRDLRAHDHEALTKAAQLGPVLCLYIIEPSVWLSIDSSQRQFVFLRECLLPTFTLSELGLLEHARSGAGISQEARAIAPRFACS